MYRHLLFWEQDKKRVAAMMQRRVRMLDPLVDILNMKVYVAFWRQISFEVAEVNQELFELKLKGKLPGACNPAFSEVTNEDDDEDVSPSTSAKRAARCNELARQSIAFYEKFMHTYHQDGKVPDKIDDDAVRTYVTARLNRARLRTKMEGLSPDEDIESHKLALQEYEWILDYGMRHPDICTKPEI